MCNPWCLMQQKQQNNYKMLNYILYLCNRKQDKIIITRAIKKCIFLKQILLILLLLLLLFILFLLITDFSIKCNLIDFLLFIIFCLNRKQSTENKVNTSTYII